MLFLWINISINHSCACTPLLSISQSVMCLNPSWRDLDWFHGSRMEGFLPTFPPYLALGSAQDSGWSKREGRFMTPQGLNYLELCKAILSQVNTALPPQLKKACTKDCGVQVNAKVNKLVQCSLGPKTLHCLECDHPPVPSKSLKSPDVLKPDWKAPCGSPSVSNLRFLRPVSIYSPIFDRRILLKKLGDDAGSEGEAEADEQEPDKEMTDHCCEDSVKDIKTTVNRSNFQVSVPELVPRERNTVDSPLKIL